MPDEVNGYDVAEQEIVMPAEPPQDDQPQQDTDGD